MSTLKPCQCPGVISIHAKPYTRVWKSLTAGICSYLAKRALTQMLANKAWFALLFIPKSWMQLRSQLLRSVQFFHSKLEKTFYSYVLWIWFCAQWHILGVCYVYLLFRTLKYAHSILQIHINIMSESIAKTHFTSTEKYNHIPSDWANVANWANVAIDNYSKHQSKQQLVVVGPLEFGLTDAAVSSCGCCWLSVFFVLFKTVVFCFDTISHIAHTKNKIKLLCSDFCKYNFTKKRTWSTVWCFYPMCSNPESDWNSMMQSSQCYPQSPQFPPI